jgi:hypothetical protein
VPDGEIQDATFGTGGVLSGTQTLISVSYDNTNNEVDFTVNDDLSQYDNSSSDFISGVDLNDSGTSTATTIDTLNFAGNLNVSDADTSDKVATIDAVDTTLSTEDGGTEVTAVTETLNFGINLSVADDGSNEVSVTNDVRFGQETFSGDGVQTEFQIAHGLSNAPSSWTIEATTDDGSGHSHSTADSTNITVFYDTAPPSGSDNIVLNYSLEV